MSFKLDMIVISGWW